MGAAIGERPRHSRWVTYTNTGSTCFECGRIIRVGERCLETPIVDGTHAIRCEEHGTALMEEWKDEPGDPPKVSTGRVFVDWLRRDLRLHTRRFRSVELTPSEENDARIALEDMKLLLRSRIRLPEPPKEEDPT